MAPNSADKLHILLQFRHHIFSSCGRNLVDGEFNDK
jgi:hypothetical protein